MSRLARTKAASLAFLLILCGSVSVLAADSPQTTVSSAETQVFVNTAFQKGKEYYDEGRYGEALKEWEAIDPYLDENPSVKKVVVFLRKQIQKKGVSTPQARVASTPAPTPSTTVRIPSSASQDEVQQTVVSTPIPPAPAAQELSPETKKVIAKAAQEIADKAREVEAKQNAAAASSARQKSLNDTFQKGKSLYDQGQYDAAFQEWDKLAGEPSLAPAIKQLKDNYAELSRQSARPAVSAPTEGLGSDATAFLDKAGRRFQAEASQLSSKAKDNEVRSKRDQEALKAVFDRANVLYAQGKYNQAIEEWKKALPIVGEDSAIGRQIISLEKNYEQMLQAKQAAEDVEKTRAAATGSDEYEAQIARIAKEISGKAQEAKQRRIQAENESSERTRSLRDAFEKGRDAYDAGRVEDAMAQWQTLSTEPQFQSVVRDVKNSYDELSRQNAALKSASLQEASLSTEIAGFLGKASQRFQSDSSQASARASDLRERMAKNQELITSIFQQARTLYYQGKYMEAVEQWRRLVPLVGPDSEIAHQIAEVESRYQNMQQAKQATDEIERSQSLSAVSPQYAAELTKANQELAAKAREASDKRSQAESLAKQRRDTASAAFQAGKALYDQGRIDDAVKEWSKLGDDPEFQSVVASLRQNARDLETASTKLDALSSDEGESMKAMTDFLSKTNERLRAQASSTQARYKDEQQKLEKSQSVLQDSFEKGKLLYYQGKYADAVEAWKAALSYVSPDSEVAKQLASMDAHFREMQQAKLAAEQIEKTKKSSSSVPPEFAAELVKADGELAAQAEALKKKRMDTELSLKQRRENVDSAFQKGKALYDQGRFEEAMKEWGQLSDEPEFQATINSMRANMRDREDASTALKSVQMDQVGLSQPVIDFFKKASQRFQAEADETAKRLEADRQKLSKTDQIVDQAFQQGKLLYFQGKYAQAVDEWAAVLPIVGENSDIGRQITDLEASYQKLLSSKQNTDEFQQKQAGGYKMPADWSKELADMNEALKAKAQESQQKRTELEASFKQKEFAIDAAFQKGKALFNQGRYEEAVAKWESIRQIAPVSSQFDALLTNSRDILKIKNDNDAALSSQAMQMKVPVSELETLVARANQNLKSEAEATKTKTAQELRAKQEMIDATFQQGQNYYAAGEYDRAALEWEKLLPYADKNSGLDKALAQFRQQTQETSDSKRALADAKQSKPKLDAQTVESLSKLMQQAGSQAMNEAADVKKQAADANKVLAERQQWINNAFESGKKLYQQGKYYEAMAEWDKITVYIEDPQAKQQLTQLRESLKNAMDAKKQAMEAAAAETAKLQTPSDLVSYLSQADASLKSQMQETLAEKSRAEASVADRQQKVQEAFEKGKTLFIQRKYEEAAREWNSLAPYLEDKAIAEQIKTLTAAMTQAAAARAQARQSQIKLEAKLPAPQELPSLLTQAQQALSAQAQDAGVARSKSEQSAADRQKAMQAGVENIKTLLSQKKYDDAASLIQSLDSYFDDKNVNTQIQTVSKNFEVLRAAQADAEAAAKRAQAKFAAPKELASLLQQTQEALKAQAQESAGAKAKSESTIVERRQWIDATITKGKSLFANKQYEEAAKTFASVAPFLDPKDPASAAIAQLQASIDDLGKANSEMKDALARQNQKFSAPADLSAVLVQFSQDLKPQIEDARNAKLKTDAAISERQRWIAATFDKGREFYKQGKFGEGIEEWSKLVPYLDDKTGIREQIGTLKQAYEDLLAARKEAVQAAANEYKSLELPAEFGSAFENAVASLKKETGSTLEQQKKSDSAAVARRQQFSDAFQKGQEFFKKGDFENAVKTWDSLSSYLDENSASRQSLSAVKSAYAELAASQSQLKDAMARQAQKYTGSAAETKILADAGQIFASQTKDAQAQKAKADQVLTERQKYIETTFQKSQSLYNDGKIDQAVELWNNILPQLDPASDAAKQIVAIKDSYAKTLAAKKDLADAVARQDMKLAFSKDKTEFLTGVNQDVTVKTKDAQAQKAKADQVLTERQKYIETTFQKSQSLYNDGKIDQAVELWNNILPQLDPASDAAKQIVAIKDSYAKTLAAKKDLTDAVARQEQKVSLSAEPVKFLVGANQDFIERTQSAIAEKTKLEADLAQKEKWALETYGNGKNLYDKGQFAEAISEWEKVIPYLGDKAEEARSTIASMRANFDQAVKARKAASEFALNQYNNIKAPYAAEMAKLLQDGTVQLAHQTQDAQAQRADMEKSFNERQAWIASTFAKGKEYAAKGQYKEANEAWSALLPYIENADAVSALMKSVDAGVSNVDRARSDLTAATDKKDAKYVAPAELSQLLSNAVQVLKTDAASTLAEKSQLDQAAAERQKWIRDTFEKGKQLYNRGQYEEAMRVWEPMLIYLQEGPQIKAGIEQVDLGYQQALDAKNVLNQAVAKKNEKFAAPPELVKLLMQAAQDLKLQAQEADGARSRAEKSVTDRKEWLASTFAKGKELYDQGKYNQAITLWQGMTAYLEESPQLNELMEQVTKSYEDTEKAKLETQQALVQQEVKLTTPENLVTLLGRAVEDLREQSRSAKAKSVDLERSRIERQQWIDATFKDGKLYYDNAEYEKAAATWEPLLPYLAEERAMRGLIQTLRENSGDVTKAKREAEEYKNKTDIRFDLPVDVAAMASDAIGRLNREVLEAQQQKTRAEQSLKERQQWVISTFQEGKLYYDQKQYREALEQWEKLTPFVDEKTGFRQLVETVRQSYKESLEAKRGAVEAVANEYKGLKLAYADEMIMLLNEADKRLKAEAADANTKRESMEKSLAERREWIVNTFNKGKIFYDQGSFQEAVEQWDRLLPYLEPGSEMKRTIESIKDNYASMTTAKQAVKESSTNQPAALDTASVAQMTTVFREASDKFKADAAQTQAKLSEVQQILSQRRSSFDQVYQKGKTLYDQGKYNEAFIEWERLSPYLDQLPDLKKQVEEAKKNYNEQFQLQQKFSEASQMKETVKPLPTFDTPSVAYGNATPSAPSIPPPASAAAAQKLTSFEKAPVQKAAPKEEEKKEEEAPAAEDDNLQFVSGEIAEVNATDKTVKLKLYSGTLKDLVLSFDSATQITGAEEGKAELKVGAAVDVRYDPASKKATYIYIYS